MPQKHTKDTIAIEISHKLRCSCPGCGKHMRVSPDMVHDVIRLFVTELALALRDDAVMQIRGLGTFRVADKRTTKWDPQLKERVPVPPAKTVRLKISQSFVDIATGNDEPYANVNPDLAMVALPADVAANFDAQAA